MADKTNQTKLFEEFPPITTEQWEAQIIKDLKGADYEKAGLENHRRIQRATILQG